MSGAVNINNADAAPYWNAAREGRLVFMKCSACAHVYFPPRHLCPKCWSDKTEWITSTGRGEVYSHTTVHRAPSDAFRSKVPYVIATVQMEEGPRLMGNVVGEGAQQVAIGDAVKVVMIADAEGTVLPQFERVAV